MNRPYDLVIFDCDGVLVETEPLANRVFVELVHEHGFEISESEYLLKFSGVTLPDRIRITSQELRWHPPEDFLPRFHERLSMLTEQSMQIVPGVRELLQSLKVPVCVASNGSRDEIMLRLNVSNLAPFFNDAIFSGLEVPNPKPAPDVYLAAAKAFEVTPSRCIVIEDSIPGITAGVSAGMRVFGYAAFTPIEKIKAAGAIPFQIMDELRQILLV